MKIDPATLKDHVVELIRRASTELPADVEEGLRSAMEREAEGSVARSTLGTILENAALARERQLPICQDTGMNIYTIHFPPGLCQSELRKVIHEATVEATKRSLLRPNIVDPRGEKNTGNNIGQGSPQFHFYEREDGVAELRLELMLKGGGSENCGIQYKLPDGALKAGRDLKGVKKAVLDAIWQAQGKGCAPGYIGVCIGGDRAMSLYHAKRQHGRLMGDTNPEPALAQLEAEIYEAANELGIGPMGFGGKTTILGVKCTTLGRLPACYFVSVSYMCWACRRAALNVAADGSVRWA